MPLRHLDEPTLRSIATEVQTANPSEFSHSLDGLLTTPAFDELADRFPPLDCFEKHEGLPRANDQRPHDRYYLGYKSSPYHKKGYRGPGIAYPEDLPKPWQAFLEEIEGPAYKAFLASTLGTMKFSLRCSWHMGMTGAEVSPHKDSLRKLAIHLFYFNPDPAWNADWGGDFLALTGCKVDRENPDFSDFEKVLSMPTTGNRSLLLVNSPEAWHGVKPLHCPDGQYRRLFSVIAEAPKSTARKMVLLARRTLGMAYPGEN